MRAMRVMTMVILGTVLSGCGYNTLQSQDEQVTAAWSEVVNQYQRRADLVPNLVIRQRVTPRKTSRFCRERTLKSGLDSSHAGTH